MDLARDRGLGGVGCTLAVLVGGSEVRHINCWLIGSCVVVIVEESVDAGRESLSQSERLYVNLYLRAIAPNATYHLSSCRHC